MDQSSTLDLTLSIWGISHSNTEISKVRPLCEKRTRVGKISTTFTPSITDPSLVNEPLITARRSEGSSCQTIPDIFSKGGAVADSFGGGSDDFLPLPGAASAPFEITFWLAFFSPGELAGVSLSADSCIFWGARFISSRASRTGSPEGAAGETC